MIATIDVSPALVGLRVQQAVDVTIQVAAIAGYACLEDLLREDPRAADEYIHSIGYWGEWSYFRMEFGRDAVMAFLAWVRKDMGV